MPKPRADELFGEPPEPQLDFLRLETPQRQVLEADISKIAKYHVTQNVVMQTKPSKGLAGLRAAEIRAVEFANPNYPPYPVTNDPEPVYLVRLDSSKTTYERAPEKWVRESKIFPRPVGTQMDAWKIVKEEWDRTWGEMDGLTFEAVEERHSREVAKKMMRERNRGMINSLSAEQLLELPISRFTHSEEAIRLGLQKPRTRKPLKNPPMLLNRSISSTQLRHGVLPKASPTQLKPLQIQLRGKGGGESKPKLPVPPPPKPPAKVDGDWEKARGAMRHKRVRNQIAPPTQNINMSENHKLMGWYEDRSPERPRYLPPRPKPKFDRFVIQRDDDDIPEDIVRTYADMPKTPYAPTRSSPPPSFNYKYNTRKL